MASYKHGGEEKPIISAVSFTSIPGAVGIPGRRFPFRAELEEDAQALAPSIAAVVTWAIGVIEGYCWGVRSRRGWNEQAREDVRQDLIVHLLEKALPRFDTMGGAKLETFLHRCLRHALIDQLRGLARNILNQSSPLSDAIPHDASPLKPLLDAEVSDLIDRIHSEPERFFDSYDASFLRRRLDNATNEVRTTRLGRLVERMRVARMVKQTLEKLGGPK